MGPYLFRFWHMVTLCLDGANFWGWWWNFGVLLCLVPPCLLPPVIPPKGTPLPTPTASTVDHPHPGQVRLYAQRCASLQSLVDAALTVWIRRIGTSGMDRRGTASALLGLGRSTGEERRPLGEGTLRGVHGEVLILVPTRCAQPERLQVSPARDSGEPSGAAGPPFPWEAPIPAPFPARLFLLDSPELRPLVRLLLPPRSAGRRPRCAAGPVEEEEELTWPQRSQHRRSFSGSFPSFPPREGRTVGNGEVGPLLAHPGWGI